MLMRADVSTCYIYEGNVFLVYVHVPSDVCFMCWCSICNACLRVFFCAYDLYVLSGCAVR